MSAGHVAPDSSITLKPPRTALQTVREALQLFGTMADGSAERRVLLAPAVVAAGALLVALTPNALELVVDPAPRS